MKNKITGSDAGSIRVLFNSIYMTHVQVCVHTCACDFLCIFHNIQIRKPVPSDQCHRPEKVSTVKQDSSLVDKVWVVKASA